MKQNSRLHFHRNCPLCESSDFSPYLEVVDHMVSHETFQIRKCESCNFLFTSPYPPQESIGGYYESQSYLSHSGKGKKSLFEWLYNQVRTYAAKSKANLVTQFADQKGVLVDFGCGTGFFLREAREKGWETRGFEISEKARNIARNENNIEAKHPDLFLAEPDNSVEAVTMWHVLEHLYNPVEHIKTCFQKLKPGGILVIAVPNPESHDAQVYGPFWAAWDVPIHLSHFSKKTMDKLITDAGFKLERIKNMPFDSFYVSLLSEKYKTGKMSWFNAMWRGLVSNVKAIGRINGSSLIYICRKV